MRFNSVEYLQAWASGKRFPAIHDDIASAAEQFMIGNRVLDLCCSYGLLGERLKKTVAGYAVGIDADGEAIAKAKAAGISIDLYQLKVTPESFTDLVQILQSCRVNAVVARRCLPELFGENLDFGRQFFAELRRVGVKEVLIEGRVKTKNATNALSSIEDEISLASESFALARRYKNVAYLRAT